jgi:osmotically-inducible protein OsmY
MRRFLFGVVIASVTAAMPAWALGGDREIAQTVMAELQQHKAAGQLKGFDIDLKVQDGVVYLTGQVASEAQRAIVERAAMNEVGRANLVSELQVKETSPAVQPRPLAQPKPQLEAQPKPQATAQPKPQATAQPKPQATAQSKPQATVQSKPQPTQTKPQSMVKVASGAEHSTTPSASDAAITDAIISSLQESKASGKLRGFDLDVSTINGDVWVKGSVANQAQKTLILDIARRVRGVTRVVDELAVTNSSLVRQVSTGAPEPVPQGSSMPVAGRPTSAPTTQMAPMAPQAFAPSGLASYGQDCYASGGPVPMQGAGGEYGVGAPRYDQPNLPSYAWPSYAAHPNYAAVTYPKQYSPSAWPYIGPFYPYPQVPLGWRKVALEWDDGLWYLDFTSK